MDSFVGLEERWGKCWLSHVLLIFTTSIIKVFNFLWNDSFGIETSFFKNNRLYRNWAISVFFFTFIGVAFRHCNPNGTWDFMHSLNKTWSNYSDCLRFLQPDINIGKVMVFLYLWVPKGKQNDYQPLYKKLLYYLIQISKKIKASLKAFQIPG